MTKTNIEKLQELREKAHEISRTNPTQIAIGLKQSFNEDLQKLKRDDDYREFGPKYRERQEEQLREKYRKELFKVLAEQKAEYKKIYEEATTLAKTIQVAEHAAPADALSVKLFEKEFESLKTATMLSTNADNSIKALDAFIGKYGDEPYFASIIKQNFAQLSQNVLSIEATPQNRHALSKVLERVDAKATTEEQAFASETLAAFGNGEAKFYYEGLAQHNAIAEVIGARHARYLNEPNEWLEAQAQAEQATE